MTTTTAHPVDTQLIGIIHDALRRDLGRTFDTLSIRAPLGARRRAALADHLTWTLAFLERHYTTEEECLWPLARRRAPTSAPMLHQLTTGHARIHHATGTVTTAVRVYRNSDTPRVRDDLRGALERLCTILLPQLDREETELTPILATTITDTEWNTWLQHHLLHTTRPAELARETYWLNDTLDPERRTVTTRLLHPHHRSLTHHVVTLSYRHHSRHLWRTRTTTGTRQHSSRIHTALHQVDTTLSAT
ncbi:hemerythrin domain-containing protein [Rhodococcus jostii]|uniref:Hemerythrin HHE cation binding domain-containing protein n=1 Tax=Rhodococcus jostii TaxID=132919 RepID=A0A1H4J6M0_RHOJO|nr:hemerythrin domain-containing protein [Rhodococcus jostii]SEB41913.1 Hemerythrin HHE cation binding domain-containing protein [Rhodococcus jostii]